MTLEVLMTIQMDSLTPAEAAVVAGVSVRDVHRMIDENILPERLFDISESRSFKRQACVFISFYVGAANSLTSEERQRFIALACKIANWGKAKKVVQDEFLTIDFGPFSKGVDERLQRLQAARTVVVSNPEILEWNARREGHANSRLRCGRFVTAGIPIDRILSAYPSLTKEQIELATLYVEATPQRGHPRRRALPPGTVVISRYKGKLKQAV